jgi:hypothetical protein
MNLLLSTRRQLGLVLELKLRRPAGPSRPATHGPLASHHGQRFRVPGSMLSKYGHSVPEAVWRFHEWAASRSQPGSVLRGTRYCLVLVNCTPASASRGTSLR